MFLDKNEDIVIWLNFISKYDFMSSWVSIIFAPFAFGHLGAMKSKSSPHLSLNLNYFVLKQNSHDEVINFVILAKLFVL